LTAAALATGGRIFGGQATEPAVVVYLDLEMARDDVRERLEDLGYSPSSDLKRLRYYQLSSIPSLDTALGGKVLENIVRRDNAGVVIIDTLARVTSGEENSADTYRAFYRCTGSRLRNLGVSLLRLDHAGKSRAQGPRGSSAKEDDVDVIFELTRSGEFLVLKCTHSRVQWVPSEVKMCRQDDGLRLRHVISPVAYPQEAIEVGGLLDDLKVPLDTSRRAAEAALKQAGHGHRSSVVGMAVKYRRRPR
jgi:hypothetical protein